MELRECLPVVDGEIEKLLKGAEHARTASDADLQASLDAAA